MAGVLGDVILVNGAPWPVLEVDAARYRLRLLNASNARRYRLEPGSAAAGRTGLRPDRLRRRAAGARRSSTRRSRSPPAERFDVVVDFGRYPVGTEVTLRNALGTGAARR